MMKKFRQCEATQGDKINRITMQTIDRVSRRRKAVQRILEACINLSSPYATSVLFAQYLRMPLKYYSRGR